MDKQEVLEQEYRFAKKSYEEQEDTLLRQRDKGLFELEELVDMGRYYLKDFVPDEDLLNQDLYGLEQLKEEFIDVTDQERRQLEKEQEELDETYSYQRKKLFYEEAEGQKERFDDR